MTSEDLDVRVYRPNPRVRVLIEDMGQALCLSTGCSVNGVDDMCGHRRLAADLVNATIDHYINEFERTGDQAVSEFLRAEM